MTVIVITYTPKGASINTTLTMPNNRLGLVGHWTFDGKDMINNVADTSGQGNNGVLLGFTSTTTVPGAVGQALTFNATGSTNQEAKLTSTISITGAESFSWWMYPRSYATAFQGIISTNLVGKSIYYHGSQGLAAGAPITLFCGGVSVGDSDFVGVLNKWTHVVVTIDSGGTVRYYSNGVLLPTTRTCSNTTGALQYIGSDNDTNALNNAPLDDVRIYNRALSAAEVLQLYQQGTGTHQNVTLNPPNLKTGLVGWWTFDGKDMIKNVADSSGQGNNGFLLNMSTTSVPGVFGQALKFVPPAGCAAGHTCTNVDIGNAASLNVATSTLTAWIYPTSVSGLQAIIASESNNGVEMLLNGNSLQSYADNAQGSICAAAGTIPVNKWSMVTASVGNLTSVDHLYVNGTEVTGTCFNGPLLFSSADWRVGGGGFFDHGAYNGFIDDVRVYNRTLSPAEVLQLYNLGH